MYQLYDNCTSPYEQPHRSTVIPGSFPKMMWLLLSKYSIEIEDNFVAVQHGPGILKGDLASFTKRIKSNCSSPCVNDSTSNEIHI